MSVSEGLGAESSHNGVFVSYASVDDELADLFVEILLVSGLGFRRSEITFAGQPATSFDGGRVWFSQIRDQIRSRGAVVALVTEAFLQSEMCVLEAGAAWCLDTLILLNFGSDHGKALGNLHQYHVEPSGLDAASSALDEFAVRLGFQDTMLQFEWTRRRDEFLQAMVHLNNGGQHAPGPTVPPQPQPNQSSVIDAISRWPAPEALLSERPVRWQLKFASAVFVEALTGRSDDVEVSQPLVEVVHTVGRGKTVHFFKSEAFQLVKEMLATAKGMAASIAEGVAETQSDQSRVVGAVDEYLDLLESMRSWRWQVSSMDVPDEFRALQSAALGLVQPINDFLTELGWGLAASEVAFEQFTRQPLLFSQPDMRVSINIAYPPGVLDSYLRLVTGAYLSLPLHERRALETSE